MYRLVQDDLEYTDRYVDVQDKILAFKVAKIK